MYAVITCFAIRGIAIADFARSVRLIQYFYRETKKERTETIEMKTTDLIAYSLTHVWYTSIVRSMKPNKLSVHTS